MLSGDSISVHTEIDTENPRDFPPKGVLATGLIAFAATLITYRYYRVMSRRRWIEPDHPRYQFLGVLGRQFYAAKSLQLETCDVITFILVAAAWSYRRLELIA